MKTIYCNILECSLLTGLPPQIIPGTTWNESMNKGLPTFETTPTIKYFGLAYSTDTTLVNDGIFAINKYTHAPTDVLPMNQLPVYMTTYEDRLDETLPNEYGLMIVETINEIDYACYYLKEVKVESGQIIELTGKVDGTLNINRITDNLGTASNDTQENIDLTDPEIKYIAYQNSINVIITSEEFASQKEYLDLKGIVGAKVSETIICSAEKVVDNLGNPSLNAVQSMYYLDIDQNIDDGIVSGKTLIFDLGGMGISKAGL